MQYTPIKILQGNIHTSDYAFIWIRLLALRTDGKTDTAKVSFSKAEAGENGGPQTS